MLTHWMLHALLLSAILTGAALAISSALRMAGAPARGVWALAGLGSFLLPLRSLIWHPADGGGVGAGATVPLLSSPDLLEVLGHLDRPLLVLWVVASALLLLRGLLGLFRLRELQGGWREQELSGLPVLVSRTAGPAVVGIRRGRIVLPQWVLRREPEIQELILAHEREHLRAKDTLLVACGGGMVLLAPWNPFLWIQFRFLRSAVEMDCDRRVLLTRPGARLAYGELLLEVGALRSPRFGLARLAGGRSTLERRIDFLLQDPRSFAPEGIVLRSSWGAVLAVMGFLFPIPPVSLAEVTPAVAPGSPGSGAGVDGVLDLLRDRPIFTPHTQPPSLRNEREVRLSLEREDPSQLPLAGVEAKVLVHMLIDEGGGVQEARLALGSGNDELDAAALRAARVFSFWPALNGDRPTPVWISLPVTFPPAPCSMAPGATAGGTPNSSDRFPPATCAPEGG